VHVSKYKTLAFATIGLLAAWFFPKALSAQRLRGPWEDATIATPGTLRLDLRTDWTYADRRFGSDGHPEPLGRQLSRTSLDTTAIPQLRELRAPLSDLLGNAGETLSLGSLSTEMNWSEYRTTISLEIGLTKGLAAAVTVPYVKNRVEVFPRPVADGPLANVGLNPALRFPGAKTRNGQVVSELEAAVGRLQAELIRCQGSSEPSCTAINADRDGAAALSLQASRVAAAIAAIYGTQTQPGLPFAPLELGQLQAAVRQRLELLNSQFRNYIGGTPSGEWIQTTPVGAAPLALNELQLLLADSTVGIVARPLGDVEHSHIGDVEAGVKLVLFDSFGTGVGRGNDEPDTERGLRFAIAGLARFPTAQLDRTDDLVDIGTGDRQTDVEMRAFLDAGLGSGFWTSLAARYTRQLAHEARLRIPKPGELFPAASREVSLQRDLGDQLDIEVSPRYVLNDALGIGVRYAWRAKGSDRFALRGSEAAEVAGYLSALEAGTSAREHRLDIALTYSTLQRFRNGLARWPLEVSLLHTRALTGNNVFRGTVTAVSLRIYRAYRRGGRI
jgi:hypothetical protein